MTSGTKIWRLLLRRFNLQESYNTYLQFHVHHKSNFLMNIEFTDLTCSVKQYESIHPHLINLSNGLKIILYFIKIPTVLNSLLQPSLQSSSIVLAIMVTVQVLITLQIGLESLQEQLRIVQVVLWLQSCSFTMKYLGHHQIWMWSDQRHMSSLLHVLNGGVGYSQEMGHCFHCLNDQAYMEMHGLIGSQITQ